MPWRAGLVAAVLMLFPPAAAAENFPVMGIGTTSCAEMTKFYRSVGEVALVSYRDWAQGFMSGLNFTKVLSGKSSRNLNAVSLRSQELRLMNYCDKHPLGRFLDGVLALCESLPEK
jgi:hypothetical protein